MKKFTEKQFWAFKFTLIFALIAIIAGVLFMREYFDSKNSQKNFNELETLIVQQTEETEEKSEQEIAYEKYKELLAKNNDFIGWIKIDGTNVNYPVMQTVDNPNFYLKHNFEKQYSDYGVPYLDEECFVDLTNNLVIYGHNMKNGTMFTDLVNYKDKSYWEEHQIINFDTMAEFSEYQVMYAFAFDTDNETFCYNDYTDMTEEKFAEFMSECENRMAYDTGIRVEYGDEILTLSTCEYTHENGRFVVVAKKIEGKVVDDNLTETTEIVTVESADVKEITE